MGTKEQTSYEKARRDMQEYLDRMVEALKPMFPDPLEEQAKEVMGFVDKMKKKDEANRQEAPNFTRWWE